MQKEHVEKCKNEGESPLKKLTLQKWENLTAFLLIVAFKAKILLD